MMVSRNFLRAAIGTAVLLAAILMPSNPAFASASGHYNADGVRIRTCPHVSSSCVVLGLGYPSQNVTITCFKTGDTINGDNIWLYHRNRSTGVVGYSADVYITTISGTIPHC
jgi:hypothetical protein